MCKIFDLSEIDDINNVLAPRVCQKQPVSGGPPFLVGGEAQGQQRECACSQSVKHYTTPREPGSAENYGD